MSYMFSSYLSHETELTKVLKNTEKEGMSATTDTTEEESKCSLSKADTTEEVTPSAPVASTSTQHLNGHGPGGSNATAGPRDRNEASPGPPAHAEPWGTQRGLGWTRIREPPAPRGSLEGLPSQIREGDWSRQVSSSSSLARGLLGASGGDVAGMEIGRAHV